MNVIDFASQVIFISVSGVLSPGPLFFANLIYGSKEGFYSGVKIASGHAIVELLLVILLAAGIFGFSSFKLTSEIIRIIGLVGGTAIIIFSISQITNIIKRRRYIDVANDKNKRRYSYSSKISNKGRRLERPFIIGLTFSALNPFFIIWWLTVGLKLISDSVYLFGIVEGILILFSFHIWMDYTWLSVTAYLMSKGRLILKERLYQYFLLSIVSFVLASYGLYLVVEKIFL
ncbi:MAG TPA: LysE family transporter [Nitrososphaeraceae archaeon]|nr:LysE family transporter [Nitrososphaeraceae archaeon]